MKIDSVMKKKIKKIMPFAGFIPAAVVCILVYTALDGYAPKVYGVEETQSKVTDKADNNTDEKNESVNDDLQQTSSGESVNTAKLLTKIDEKARYKDGTYYGTGMGFAGTITVKVIITGGKIESVVITDTKDGSEFVKKASSILTNIVKMQSTNVDTVSGATYSSNGIIEAVRDALKQAVISQTDGTKDVTMSENAVSSSDKKSNTGRLPAVKEYDDYKDGIYYGTGTGFEGEIRVKVKIQNGKISDIQIIESVDGAEFIKSARGVIDDILKKQSTNVDTVTGATYSSNGIIEAVRNALKNAVKNPENTTTVINRETTIKPTQYQTTAKETTSGNRNVKYKDGIYYGTGEGFRGDIIVGVVIENDKIQYILVTKAGDDDAFVNKAKGLIPDIIKKQGTDVDTVSGATFSSEGIIEAVNKAMAAALKQSGNVDTTETSTQRQTTTKAHTDITGSGHEDNTITPETTQNNRYKNGTYNVTVNCTPDEEMDFDEYQLSANVTINNDIITNISDIKGAGTAYDSSNDWYIKRAITGTSRYLGVVAQLKGKSTALAAVVSGATCSSKAIIDAVQKALEDAERLR